MLSVALHLKSYLVTPVTFGLLCINAYFSLSYGGVTKKDPKRHSFSRKVSSWVSNYDKYITFIESRNITYLGTHPSSLPSWGMGGDFHVTM